MSCVKEKFSVIPLTLIEDDFNGKVQPKVFRNLKKNLRKHLVCDEHTAVLKDTEAKEKLEEKVMSRERKIGRVLGLVAYYRVFFFYWSYLQS